MFLRQLNLFVSIKVKPAAGYSQEQLGKGVHIALHPKITNMTVIYRNDFRILQRSFGQKIKETGQFFSGLATGLL